MRSFYASVVFSVLLACGCSKPLFNGRDLSGWVEIGSRGAWSVEEGILKCSGQKKGYAWLSTDGQYSDFELVCDWRIEPEANAGIFCRAPSREGRTSQKGFEVQIKDDRQDPDFSDVTGAVFSRIPAAGKFSKPPGEWNRLKITCVGRRLCIELNGKLISDTDMDTVK
ncbi:MAG: 3-keto-disaccharide hydrolase, partial [Planctomycetota bacterium]